MRVSAARIAGAVLLFAAVFAGGVAVGERQRVPARVAPTVCVPGMAGNSQPVFLCFDARDIAITKEERT